MLSPSLKAFTVKPDQSNPSFLPILLIGIAQIIVWGGSFFLLAVLARPIMAETGWGRELVYGALSLSILVSAFALPYIGHLISRYGGRELLGLSGMVTALGLVIMAFSFHIVTFFLAWIVIGFGMALGLYDTLFAVLGHIFGQKAKSAITSITLISGFCTTIVWPVQAYGVSMFGWRSICLFGAALMMLIIWPIYHYALPKFKPETNTPTTKVTVINTLPKQTYCLLSIIFMITSIIMTVMSVQLIDILQENGISLTAAIAISALLGPSQVASRILDLLVKFDHPIKSLLVSVIFVLAGVFLLILSPKYAALAVIIYGAGNGLRSIVRGTLPLTLVKKEEYAAVMGKLARPSLIAQALTPLIAGYVMDLFHAETVLYSVAILALVNVAFSVFLMRKINLKSHQNA